MVFFPVQGRTCALCWPLCMTVGPVAVGRWDWGILGGALVFFPGTGAGVWSTWALVHSCGSRYYWALGLLHNGRGRGALVFIPGTGVGVCCMLALVHDYGSRCCWMLGLWHTGGDLGFLPRYRGGHMLYVGPCAGSGASGSTVRGQVGGALEREQIEGGDLSFLPR